MRHGDVDAAVVAYPHAASAPVVAALRARGVRVVDLSADFRLSAPPPMNDGTARIRTRSCSKTPLRAARAAPPGDRRRRPRRHPGCYPTASLLGLAPLARVGLIADLVIDAKQGLSGAGRFDDWQTHLSTAARISFLTTSSTTATLRRSSSSWTISTPRIRALRVQFHPHLVPLDQGELVNCYVTPTRPMEQDELDVMYEDAYAGEPFVELAPAPAEVRDVRETNVCRLHAAPSEHTGKVVVLSAIDNLWKGSSSQAVQNLNLMFGFAETAGLL